MTANKITAHNAGWSPQFRFAVHVFWPRVAGRQAASHVMKKHDDYISGPHHFWVHFGCGLVFGGALGAWWSWNLFESTFLNLVAAAVTGLLIAYCCGRWGDSAWHWIIARLPWFP